MDSSKPLAIQMALVKLSKSQNETKRHEWGKVRTGRGELIKIPRCWKVTVIRIHIFMYDIVKEPL